MRVINMKKKEKLDIIYEDKYIIAVSKSHNLLTIGTDKERDKTLYRKVSDYVKKQHKSNKIFIVHRLDKDTSGIVLFAKTEDIKRKLQQDWDKTKRYYIAVVEGEVKKGGTIKNWQKETKTLYTYSSNIPKDGLLAITKYEPIYNTKEYSMLKIQILTGRKNQIRVHMKDINHPIVGDKKYGSVKNPIRRMMLHATNIEFIHPNTNKLVKLESKVPEIFKKIIKMN